jgi:hypothetical protein
MSNRRVAPLGQEDAWPIRLLDRTDVAHSVLVHRPLAQMTWSCGSRSAFHSERNPPAFPLGPIRETKYELVYDRVRTSAADRSRRVPPLCAGAACLVSCSSTLPARRTSSYGLDAHRMARLAAVALPAARFSARLPPVRHVAGPDKRALGCRTNKQDGARQSNQRASIWIKSLAQ